MKFPLKCPFKFRSLTEGRLHRSAGPSLLVGRVSLAQTRRTLACPALFALALAAFACGPSEAELNRLIDQRAQAIVAAAPTITPPGHTHAAGNRHASARAHTGAYGHAGTHGHASAVGHAVAYGYPGAYGYSGAYRHAAAHRYARDVSTHTYAGDFSLYTNSPADGHSPADHRFEGDSPGSLAVGVYGRDQPGPRVRLAD